MSHRDGSQSWWRTPGARRGAMLLFGLCLWLLCGVARVFGDYGTLLVATIAFNAIAVLSISTLAGATGIWSLGHTAFIALGAYVAANLAGLHWPIEAIVPAVALAAALLGFVLGLSAGRFSILYFGLLTMAVALTAMEIIGRLSGLTGGDQGMAVPGLKSLLAGRALGSGDAVTVGLILATLTFVLADVVINGARGRRWRAVKSHRIAANSLGLVPHMENALALAFSAALAAVAGVANALTIGYLEPESFNLDAGVMLIVATVVGGIASFWGALFGAAFIIAVPELSRGLKDLSAFSLGLSMVVILLFLPRGIMPSLLGQLGRWWGRGAARGAAPASARAAGADLETRIASLVAELMPRSSANLELRGVGVSFGGLKALDDVSLTLSAGKTLGLIGPNGAGKTTLLNVLSGYVRPNPGAVARLGERDLLAVAPYRRLRHGFGRTFQHAELFNELTIREMLLLAATVGRATAQHGAAAPAAVTAVTSPEALVERILAALNLTEVAGAYPEELPFGMQKVADIGRIIAMGPGLVALDEPFSGLDHEEARELRAILRGMRAAGVSILIIDHAVQEVLDIADHVVVLDFGKVLASGTPAEIARNEDVQRAYFGTSAAALDPAARAGGEAVPAVTDAAAGATVADSVAAPGTRPAAIAVSELRHRYAGVLALDGLSLTIDQGGFCAILGPNGAGKSTLAQILAGLLKPTEGALRYADIAPAALRPGRGLIRSGICLVPEGRRLFADLSVEENLLLGGYGAGLSSARSRQRLAEVVKILPEGLRTGMRTRRAGMLSGGERQILAVARALMASPRLIIIDEPSMGLAPILINRVYEILDELRAAGVTIVVVEQQATHALERASVLHVLERGRLRYSGPATGAAVREALLAGYVGEGAEVAGGMAADGVAAAGQVAATTTH